MDDDSDLHLLSVTEAVPEDGARIRGATGHGDARFKHGSAIDEHAFAFDLFTW
jgi:hypothetical protein